MTKAYHLLMAAAGFLALAANPASAQFPMDGTPGGPQKMDQAFEIKEKKETIKQNRLEGLMDRAMHRMKVTEKKELNKALVERGSLVTADGEVIEQNKDPGEQVIDPRTPKGFGNPFFRAIHVEQNIKVNDLLTEFEQKELARLKWQENEDVKANATEEIQAGAGWTPVIAAGEMQTPAVRSPEFMAYFEVSPNKIIRRICESCDDDFKDIYYKRLTDTYDRNLYTMLKDGPFDQVMYKDNSNECWVDFTLHSTYEDAISGANPWEYCRPDTNKFDTGKNIGFPSYSGPNGHDEDNINQGSSRQQDYAFYVETPDWIPTAGTYRLNVRGKRDGEDIEGYHISRISEYLDLSPNRIARRVCNDCVGVYRDVYFKHKAPEGISVTNVEKFLLEDFQPFGVPYFEFRQEFDIYSTYEDAIAEQNPWEYCEWLPANKYGFPGLCRPKKSDAAIPAQWTRIGASGGSITCNWRDGQCAQHTCLYIEAAAEDQSPDRVAWMSDDEEMELFFYGKKDALPVCLEEGQAQANNLGNGAMTVHATATVGQKYHSQVWLGNPAKTYDGARNFCLGRGMDLCPRAVVCPDGSNPDGGVRSGDQWVPVLDEHNQWVQVANWGQGRRRELWDGTVQQNPTYTCMTHQEIVGSKPVWGLYGQDAWEGSMTFLDRVMCCGVADEYQYDDYAGWYDVRRCGSCHDFCFWMSVDGTAYNPTYEAGSNPWHTPVAYDNNGAIKAFFTCNLSGSGSGELSTGLDFLENDSGVNSFPYQKCGFEGQHTHDYRQEEYMGCFRTGNPQALPELVGEGQPFTFSKCADACASRNYHYFGRMGNGQCRCGGRTRDDYTFKRYGLIPYGSSDYCKCDADDIGNAGMCTYRVVDQFDPNTARKNHPCRYLPAQDMRKMCYIACRDGNKNMANKLTCKLMETMGRTYLSKMINKHYDKGGKQLHMLGGDVATATALGTF